MAKAKLRAYRRKAGILPAFRVFSVSSSNLPQVRLGLFFAGKRPRAAQVVRPLADRSSFLRSSRAFSRHRAHHRLRQHCTGTDHFGFHHVEHPRKASRPTQCPSSRRVAECFASAARREGSSKTASGHQYRAPMPAYLDAMDKGAASAPQLDEPDLTILAAAPAFCWPQRADLCEDGLDGVGSDRPIDARVMWETEAVICRHIQAPFGAGAASVNVG
jgi:hypothetical protein